MRWSTALLTCWLIVPGAALAGEADVVDAQLTPAADGSFRFEVTVRHADTGWEHYADAFEVVAPDGGVLGTRILLHPHVDEQPFTRSLAGVRIPDDVAEVTIRAHDSEHGYGGQELTIPVRR
jgi:hypothetical protein